MIRKTSAAWVGSSFQSPAGSAAISAVSFGLSSGAAKEAQPPSARAARGRAIHPAPSFRLWFRRSIDPTHAALIFRINHLGYSDLIGRFESFDVSLTGDASDPASARADAVIDMTSLDIANDSFAEELMGPKFFDAARYPQAVFRTLSVTPGESGGAEVNGELTLHGQTRPVTLDVQFNGTAFDPIRPR